MKKLSKEDYIRALRKLENSPSDRIGILGKIGIAGAGAGVGALGASSVASMFGSTTLLGSTWLASIAGGVFVTTTPIGWVIGTATAGSIAAYGLSKLVYSGGKNDERKKSIIEDIKNKIDNYKNKIQSKQDSNKIGQVAGAYAELLENNLIDKEKVTAILAGVENGSINAEQALVIAENILNEASNAKSLKIIQ